MNGKNSKVTNRVHSKEIIIIVLKCFILGHIVTVNTSVIKQGIIITLH